MAFEYKNMTSDGLAVVRTTEAVKYTSEDHYDQQTEDIKSFLAAEYGGQWECDATEINVDGTESSGWRKVQES